jgi:hypothetical protein
MKNLFHSGTPLFLSVQDFTTAVYLINWLSSFALVFETPYFKLHGHHPNYSVSRVFGFKYFPYTWDTRQHKFDPKTVICIFAGYSDTHKGYKCFHPFSKKKKNIHIKTCDVWWIIFFPIKILWTQALHLPSLISTTFLVHGYLTLTILYKNSASSIVHVMHNPSSTNATLYSKLKVYIWCSSTPSRWKSS